MDNLIWKPTLVQKNKSHVTRFMRRQEIEDIHELIQRATTGIEWFWDASTHETQIEWFEPYTQLLDASEGFLKTRWFLGGRTNLVLNCLDRHVANPKVASKIALIFQNKKGEAQRTSYEELGRTTNTFAAALVRRGVQKGQLVSLMVPACADAVALLLAVWKLGAIAVPFPITLSPQEEEEKCALLNIKHRLTSRDLQKEDSDSFPNIVSTEELPSEYPSLVLFSRGTTGVPKPLVHTHAGVLAQVSKEFWFHLEFAQTDVSLWQEPFGSLMSLWQIIGTLHFGGTAVFYDGGRVEALASELLALCEREGVTHFGFSPSTARALKSQLGETCSKYKLNKLRVLSASGGPWDLETYHWCFNSLGRAQCPIITLAVTAELMGSFLAPLQVQDISPLSFQGPALGVSVAVYGEGGYALDPGQTGRLVCRKPTPSMAKGIWNDQARYEQTYFEKFPHVWNQQDWAVCLADGQWFLSNRAEDTTVILGQTVLLSALQGVLLTHPLVESVDVTVCMQRQEQALKSQVVLKKGVGKTVFLVKQLKESLLSLFQKQKPHCELEFNKK